MRARLRRHGAALEALRHLGLTGATIDRYELGLKAPYRSRQDGHVIEDAVSFPVPDEAGRFVSRFAFYNMEGVTTNPPHPVGWGVGEPRSYWSGVATRARPLVVVSNPMSLWLLTQSLALLDGPEPVVLTRTHTSGEPREWKDPAFWSAWSKVTLVPDGSAQDEALHVAIASRLNRTWHLLAAPLGSPDWAAHLAGGAAPVELADALHQAPPWSGPADLMTGGGLLDQVGEFEADPVHVATAFVDGNIYYPYLVEERRVEAGRAASGHRLVQHYGVRVLRSDGEVLKVHVLDAPVGTGASARVLALSDGTRITSEPSVSRFASWRFASIENFVRNRARETPVHRPFEILLSEVEAELRAAAWLPDPSDHLIAALYVAMSFVYQAFDALPLLHIHGPKGSGKSELGGAIADLGCNGVVIGQASAAGAVRLMNEARGVLVLDDLEKIAASAGSGYGDIAQALKLSYKKSTARKPVADSAGHITTLDHFGPRVVTNTRGADPILGSRMIAISTAPMPNGLSEDELPLGCDGDRVSALRDELHAWGMVNAGMMPSILAKLPAIRSRQAEIERPLRALARLAGVAVDGRLSAALARRMPVAAESVEERVVGALRVLASQGLGGEVALAQLQLELAVSNGRGSGTADVSPEALGHALRGLGLRRGGDDARRERLNGVVSRVVRLDERAMRESGLGIDAAIRDPFAFCRAIDCGDCRYQSVCRSVQPVVYAGKKPPSYNQTG